MKTISFIACVIIIAAGAHAIYKNNIDGIFPMILGVFSLFIVSRKTINHRDIEILPSISNDTTLDPPECEVPTITWGYFKVTNGSDLAWEGIASSKEELQERFPGAIVTATDWEQIPYINGMYNY